MLLLVFMPILNGCRRSNIYFTHDDKILSLKYHDTLIVPWEDGAVAMSKGKYIDWGIFGLGSMNGHTCIVSTFRLKKGKQGERLLTKRLVDVVNHELGHTFGFKHCPNTGCLMEDAKGTIKTVDNSNGKFCKKCLANNCVTGNRARLNPSSALPILPHAFIIKSGSLCRQSGRRCAGIRP